MTRGDEQGGRMAGFNNAFSLQSIGCRGSYTSEESFALLTASESQN